MLNDNEEITVKQAAAESGLSKRYINAEIERGNLAARTIEGLGNPINVIKRSDFVAWLANPARGSGHARRARESGE